MTVHVRDDGTLDEQLRQLGLERTGEKGYPLNGQLYLGRGIPGTNERGVYRSTRKSIPQEGFSSADVFEFLRVVDNKGIGAKDAEEVGG